MKKIMIAAVGMVVAIQAASASVAVRWQSNGGAYNNGTTWDSGPWPSSSGLRQLLWSSVNPSAAEADVQWANLFDPSNTWLLQTYAPGGGDDYAQWTDADTGGLLQFDNTDVGGNDINSGYLFSRVFQDATPVVGEFYYQAPAILVSTPYDFLNPSTIYTHSATGSTEVELDLPVVPEPGTLAFGLVGLGLLAYRRMRKA